MISQPKILRETLAPYRVFISWNGEKTWWEVVPEQWSADGIIDPRVTIEYFSLPQGNYSNLTG